MPAAKRAGLSFSEQQRLGDHLVLGNETADVNYRIGVEMYTEDPEPKVSCPVGSCVKTYLLYCVCIWAVTTTLA